MCERVSRFFLVTYLILSHVVNESYIAHFFLPLLQGASEWAGGGTFATQELLPLLPFQTWDVEFTQQEDTQRLDISPAAVPPSPLLALFRRPKGGTAAP